MQSWLAVGLLSTAALVVEGGEAPAAPEAPPKPEWESSAGLGVTLTKGNSDTLLFTADAKTVRKWERNELSLAAGAGYGENDGTQNVGFAVGSAQFNHLFSDRFFVFGRVAAQNDAIADIDYRVALTAGAGYYIVKNERHEWSVEVGPGYLWEKKGGVTDSYPTLRIAEQSKHKITDRARIWQKVDFLPDLTDFANFILAAEVGVESDITKSLSLRVVLQDIYNNRPAVDRKKNDLKLVAGVAYKF